MCKEKEFEDEVEKIQKLAEQLAEHLHTMSSAQCEIPVTIDSGCYIVNIRKTL
jgi:hypothetical protein